MNLQELSLDIFGYEFYECPFCGRVYSEFESHEFYECPFCGRVFSEFEDCECGEYDDFYLDMISE